MKTVFHKFILLLAAWSFTAYGTYAQCVMCRSAIENDKDVAEGMNSGILYLMGIPYIILGVTLYFVLKRRKERRAEGKE